MRRFRFLTLVLAVSVAVVGCWSTPAPAPTATPGRLSPSPPATGTPMTAPASPIQPTPSPTRVLPIGRATAAPATPAAVSSAPTLSLGIAAGNTYSAQAVSLDARRGLAYVLGRSGGDYQTASGIVAVVDLASRQVRATTFLPLNPDFTSAMALSAGGDRLHILCSSGGKDSTLLIISTGAGQGHLGDVLVQRPGVRAMALDAAASQLYLVEGTRLRQLDAATMKEQRSTTVPDFPPIPSNILMAASHQAGRVYVSGPNFGSILVFRTQDMAAAGTIALQGRIKQLLAAPDREQLYALVEGITGPAGPAIIAVIQKDRLAASWTGDQSFSSGRLAIDPATSQLLVLDDALQAQVQGSRIRLLDPATGDVLETVNLPYLNLTYARETFVYDGQIYRLGEQLTPIALASGGVGKPIDLGISLVSAALDAPANRLYVLDSTGAIHVVDTTSFKVVATWPGILQPPPESGLSAALTVAGGRLYVPDRWAQVTHVLDAVTGKEVGTIPRDGQVTIDARHNRLYVTNQGVYLVDAASLQVTGSISETMRAHPQLVVPGAAATQYDDVHDLLFVTMTNNSPGSGSSTWLQIYDGTSQARVSSTIKTSQQFVASLALAPAADRVWVSSSFPGQDLSVFTSAGQLVARLQGLGNRLFPDPARQRLYVADWGGVVTIDTTSNTVIGFRPLSLLSPSIMVYDPRHCRLYVSPTSSADVLVINPEQPADVVAQEAAALSPFSVARLVVDSGGAAYIVAWTDEQWNAIIFRSTGGEWLPAMGNLPARTLQHLVAAPDVPGTLFAYAADASHGNGLFRTTDSGRTWQVSVRGLTDFRIKDLAISPRFSSDGTAVLIAGDAGVFVTHDKGLTWAKLSDAKGTQIALAAGPAGQLTVMLLAQDDTDMMKTLVYAGSPAGLERIATLDTPLYAADSLALSPNFATDGIALRSVSSSGADWQSGLFRSQDGGRTWRQTGPTVSFDLPGYTILFSPAFAADHTVYVLVTPQLYRTQDNTVLLRSTDGGQQWQEAANADVLATAGAIGPDGRLWLANRAGSVRSLDPATLSWQAVAALVTPPVPTPAPTPTGQQIPSPAPTPRPSATATARPIGTPPAGLFKPEGAFASLWASDEYLRQEIGWAQERQPHDVPVAIEAFESGEMIWRGDTRQIAVLLRQGTWLLYDDTWVEGQPEQDPAIVAPTGLFQPKRGFGKVWQTYPEVRSALGWALEQEKGYTVPLQVFEHGVLLRIGSQTYGLITGTGGAPNTLRVWYAN